MNPRRKTERGAAPDHARKSTSNRNPGRAPKAAGTRYTDRPRKAARRIASNLAPEARAIPVGIVLVGVGGQGILLATQIAARAAMLAGFDVKTNEVHGMAQRGGSVVAQIRYGEKVASPLVPDGTARVLASLERIEALRYSDLLAPDGLAVVSSQAIIPVTVSSGKAAYPADAEQRLRRVFPRLMYVDAVGIAEGLCDIRTANVVVIGALSTALPLPESCWLEALTRCVKPKYVEVNTKAFMAGRALA